MPKQTVGRMVRERREAVSLTQEELAERVGMSQRWVSSLENDEVKSPRLGALHRLATVLGLDMADLVIAADMAKTQAEAQRIAESAAEDEMVHVATARISRNEARQRLTRLADDLDNRELLQLVTLAGLMKRNRGEVQTYEVRLDRREGHKLVLSPPGEDDLTDEEPLQASGR